MLSHCLQHHLIWALIHTLTIPAPILLPGGGLGEAMEDDPRPWALKTMWDMLYYASPGRKEESK